MSGHTKIEIIFKLLFACLLLQQSWQLYFSPQHWAFISNVNLIFHEAGHVLFSFFNQPLYVLGGTVLELFVPVVVAAHFWLNKKYFAFGFGAWWLSTALISVGVYAADAKERQLPLITGDPNTHDWMYLLGEFGLLRYDDIIGGTFIVLSFFVLMIAVVVFSKHLWNICTPWSGSRTSKPR